VSPDGGCFLLCIIERAGAQTRPRRAEPCSLHREGAGFGLRSALSRVSAAGAPVAPWTLDLAREHWSAPRPPSTLGTNSRWRLSAAATSSTVLAVGLPSRVGQRATDDLGRDSARELCLRDPAARPGDLGRTDERVDPGDLSRRSLELLAGPESNDEPRGRSRRAAPQGGVAETCPGPAPHVRG